MPYTVNATDRDGRVECYGVFDSATLAARFAERSVRNKRCVVVSINEPLAPENFLSLEALKNACNFALTTLRSYDKSKKNGTVDACIEELRDALGDKPAPLKMYTWSISDGRSTARTVNAPNEEEAVRLLNYPERVIREWSSSLNVQRIGDVAA